MSIDFEILRDKAAALVQSGAAKAKELTDTGVTKAKELSEIGKLKVQSSAEQDAIRKAYAELGKLYYAERGSAPEAAYADLCRKITDSLAKIAYNNERIADIKAAGNVPAGEDEAEPAPAGEEAETCESCCADETVTEGGAGEETEAAQDSDVPPEN